MICACAVCNQVKITLSPAETTRAVAIGHKRYVEDRKKGLQHRYGVEDSIGPDLIGAIGEAAFAKYVKLPHTKGRLGDSDVGAYEVRGTEGAGRCLLLHPKDPDDAIFVLVQVLAREPVGRCAIVGWLQARDGKQKSFWQERVRHRPAYFIPAHVLQPLASLPMNLKKIAS
jgi:hypothetical protein